MNESENLVPKRRFKEFTNTGTWEQRKLGSIYQFQYGHFNNNPDNGGIYPIYGANGIIGGYHGFNAENSVVIGHMGAYAGHVLWVEGKHFVTYNGTIGFPKDLNFDRKFGFHMLQHINIPKITAGSGQPFVSYSDLENIKLYISDSIDEQNKLGYFFDMLENTIALHQRQLENYSQLKNAMIQKIFNKELRFKNENGNDYSDWEKKRLGEILAEVVRKSTKQDQHVILSSTNKGLFLQSEYFISNIASADNIGYKIMRKSEIVFSPQNLWMGNINYNDKYEIGLVSPSYKIFAISEEVIPKFMKFMIKTPYLMNEYLLSSEQGASVVRRNLDMDLFNKILVEIPSLPEQHQIASFLAALDCNIDQLTRKIELVKDKKKGLLQLMFI